MLALKRLINKPGRWWNAVRQRLFHARLRSAGVVLGPQCYVARGSTVAAGTVFERGTRVNGASVFKGSSPIRIGRYCGIGDGVRMISSNHGVQWLNLQRNLQRRLGFPAPSSSRGPITIGHNSWIGDGATILSGVSIGNGAVVGASAVVTRDVPAFAVAAGSPARVIRTRFSSEMIARLNATEWWRWSEEEMRRRRDLFGAELTNDP